ncbi:hypothetical protein [Kitasatospora sp. NPDC088783]|uniref:hypothetical protein n=1 Tax=Kitasatospora sp. NPDC088783 TaxID=3364077 RepID=UPI003812AAE2
MSANSTWPQFNSDRAHRELRAIELLTQGVSETRVRQQTKLSEQDVRELATMCAEEAANPQSPQIVCRAPRFQPRATGARRRPARASGHQRIPLTEQEVHRRQPPEELSLF